MTSDQRRSLLIVEDDLALQKQIKWSLDRFDSITADDRESALVQIRRHNPAVVTMDLGLPPDADSVSEGFKLLERILALDADTKVIVLTGQNDQANALRAVALGAYDFFAKPFEPELLNLTVERAFRLFDLQKENRRLQELHQPDALAGLLTRDPEMLRVCRMIEKVAGSNATVMLLGESGTGKEVLANGLHQASSRRAGKFVAINCAAIPENLLESELFGYEKGAFTGATTSKPGKFELADKGTLFLDEIGDVPPAIQVKLLRVLQERQFERLGGTKTIKVDVRLVAATNRDLRAALEDGTFREDLYYRLNVVPIDIAPLREHKEDIPELVNLFLSRFAQDSGKKLSGISPQALKMLMDYHWPGNVRELQNILERASALSAGPLIDVDDIHIDTRAGKTADFPSGFLPEGMTLEQWEDEMIQEALRRAQGNKSQAARLLGLSRNALRYRLSKIGIGDDPEKDNEE